MKAHTRIINALASNGPTIVFATGLSLVWASVAQWSPAAAGVIVGLTLMLMGAAPAVLVLTRARAPKE